MTIDAAGPVSVGEVREVVAALRHLSARASENNQQAFHFVLSVGAESLADNIEMAEEWGDDE